MLIVARTAPRSTEENAGEIQPRAVWENVRNIVLESSRKESADGSGRVRRREARAQGKDAEAIFQGFAAHPCLLTYQHALKFDYTLLVKSMQCPRTAARGLAPAEFLTGCGRAYSNPYDASTSWN
jgi:hypothetical protein